jgi:type VI secretion system secreted protein VgrG
MKVQTALGKDVLLLINFQGTEGISELFRFTLEMLATNDTTVPFDKVLGQKAIVELELPGDKKRFFSGIISKLSQGKRDDTFTSYRAELVPQLWLLTRRVQCRIFQHISVPDILKKVLAGLDIAVELEGTFDEREYCVQFNESDFAFASRLMEEEGICYYFRHAESGHTLVLTNSNQKFKDVPEYKTAIFGDIRAAADELRITRWEKTQELRSGKVTVWDHSFELPKLHLDAEKVITDSVPVGKETHKLKLANNDKLEIYEYPGEYATWFDGIDRGGGEQSDRLKKIFDHNKRIAEIRMQEEAAASVVIEGTSTCRQFTSGFKFTLERHFNADGAYLLTRLEHSAALTGNYRTGEGTAWSYQNRFTCIPLAVHYRPRRKTPQPRIDGTQTAVVVGSPGEIIYPDKYGRVKIQFFWDREGKLNADSSCWVRVSNNWGGAQWGGMFLPHVGQEVIVSFENGDPDRPIITGRVYNADTMPPLGLPDHKTKSAIRDHGGNEIIMQGHDGVQQVRIHSPTKNTTFTIGDKCNPPEGASLVTDGHGTFKILENVSWDVDGNHKEDIAKNESITVHGHHNHKTKWTSHEIVGGLKAVSVGGVFQELAVVARTEETIGYRGEVTGAYKKEHVKLYSNLSVGLNYTITVGKKMETTVKASDHILTVSSGNSFHTVSDNYELGAKEIAIRGEQNILIADGKLITLSCGDSSITLKDDGTITIKGKNIHINADEKFETMSKSDTTIAAKGKAIIASTQLVSVQGKPFEVVSGSGGEIKTEAAMTIKGGQVNINC